MAALINSQRQNPDVRCDHPPPKLLTTREAVGYLKYRHGLTVAEKSLTATVLTCNEIHKIRAAQPRYQLVREGWTASVKAQNQSGPADPPARNSTLPVIFPARLVLIALVLLVRKKSWALAGWFQAVASGPCRSGFWGSSTCSASKGESAARSYGSIASSCFHLSWMPRTVRASPAARAVLKSS